jgi:EmrB/QacA subfamily drug resistance transporter
MRAGEGISRPSNGPKWMVLAAVMLGGIMGPIDASIVNIVLPSITNFFHADIAIAQWVLTAYLLTISSLLLPYGRLGDMLGFKRVYLVGLATFTATSVLCGLSQSIGMLISFRALQGVGAGMTMAVSFAIITSVFPPEERGKALGINAIAIAAGLAIGPTLGGVIAQHLGWRFVFFINVPIGIAALVWVLRVVPRGLTRSGLRLDLPGAITAFVSLLCLVLYANRGQSWGWSSSPALILLSMAIISGLLFVHIERRASQPMLNLGLLANRTFSLASLSSLINFMAQYATVFVTPFYLMSVLHFSVEKVGWVMAASPIAILCVAPASGAMSDRIGTRLLAVCGTAIGSVALFLMSGLDASASPFDVMWRLALCGFGTAIFQSPNNSAVMGSVPRAYLGVASGILATMRNVGMVLGITVAGAVVYGFAPFATSQPPSSFTSVQCQQFLSAVQWTYVAGAVLAATASLTSIAASKRRGPSEATGEFGLQ